MTEDEARAWLDAHFDVPRETWDRLERYVSLLLSAMDEQNLIAESTRPHVWARHIVDSAQLLLHAKDAGEGPWMDLGSGAGLPGIVVAYVLSIPLAIGAFVAGLACALLLMLLIAGGFAWPH